MKLVSFATGKQKSYGLHTAHGIVDVGRHLRERFPDIKTLLSNGGLAEAAKFEKNAPDYREQDLVFLPTIEQPNKIFCVGMNYAEKRQEFGETNNAPTLFIRFPDSQTGHACPVLKPRHTDEFDYEGELAVIIGKAGLGIPAAQAYEHVAGYSCYMDGSVRDWQHSWFTAGKNWRQTGAFGPWLVTTDEIPDPHTLFIRTFLNGQMVQDDNTANMVHRIPELIEYISTFSALSPGDVIITGSPGGVGKKRTPPLFLKEGDLIEVEIERIGRLRNVILRDAAVA
ncbi:fumarylacetoacetate hydrolase family protein [Telmatospirillum siberiense]|uniref:5-oxopent-3-ene-1,2,5-tricarboxylate decarboxylase n=1 Tax=Telmatospirillum siberiense TaxID=382514 RepID=A0A2N3PQG6_9PROT|nr:fumarylacetoacetate hydrolase family protein [Telmatospirillum siberiense]PKU22646.1 5-oxopent-3-ene-1,2,5-tricarboxylate decarboxylase [Telmatospirillum siberiense]